MNTSNHKDHDSFLKKKLQFSYMKIWVCLKYVQDDPLAGIYHIHIHYIDRSTCPSDYPHGGCTHHKPHRQQVHLHPPPHQRINLVKHVLYTWCWWFRECTRVVSSNQWSLSPPPSTPFLMHSKLHSLLCESVVNAQFSGQRGKTLHWIWNEGWEELVVKEVNQWIWREQAGYVSVLGWIWSFIFILRAFRQLKYWWVCWISTNFVLSSEGAEISSSSNWYSLFQQIDICLNDLTGSSLLHLVYSCTRK